MGGFFICRKLRKSEGRIVAKLRGIETMISLREFLWGFKASNANASKADILSVEGQTSNAKLCWPHFTLASLNIPSKLMHYSFFRISPVARQPHVSPKRRPENFKCILPVIWLISSVPKTFNNHVKIPVDYINQIHGNQMRVYCVKLAASWEEAEAFILCFYEWTKLNKFAKYLQSQLESNEAFWMYKLRCRIEHSGRLGNLIKLAFWSAIITKF